MLTLKISLVSIALAWFLVSASSAALAYSISSSTPNPKPGVAFTVSGDCSYEPGLSYMGPTEFYVMRGEQLVTQQPIGTANVTKDGFRGQVTIPANVTPGPATIVSKCSEKFLPDSPRVAVTIAQAVATPPANPGAPNQPAATATLSPAPTPTASPSTSPTAAAETAAESGSVDFPWLWLLLAFAVGGLVVGVAEYSAIRYHRRIQL